MSYFSIYLLTLIFKLNTIFFLLTLLLLSVFFITGLCVIAGEFDIEDKKVAKKFKYFFIGFLVSLFFTTVIPDKKDLALIVGGKMAIDIVQDKEVQKEVKEVYKIFKNSLKEEI